MKHRGRLLQDKLREANISVTKFAKEYGYSFKSSLYQAFENPKASLDLFIFAIRKYGLVFTDKELPELNKEMIGKLGDLIKDENFISIHEHNSVVIELQRKYILEKERNERLMEEIEKLKTEIIKLKK